MGVLTVATCTRNLCTEPMHCILLESNTMSHLKMLYSTLKQTLMPPNCMYIESILLGRERMWLPSYVQWAMLPLYTYDNVSCVSDTFTTKPNYQGSKPETILKWKIKIKKMRQEKQEVQAYINRIWSNSIEIFPIIMCLVLCTLTT